MCGKYLSRASEWGLFLEMRYEKWLLLPPPLNRDGLWRSRKISATTPPPVSCCAPPRLPAPDPPLLPRFLWGMKKSPLQKRRHLEISPRKITTGKNVRLGFTPYGQIYHLGPPPPRVRVLFLRWAFSECGKFSGGIFNFSDIYF